MSDTNLGKDGTIPNSDDGIALGHDPDGSHFNQEEEETPTTASTGSGSVSSTVSASGTVEPGAYTDSDTDSDADIGGGDREDRSKEPSGSYTDVDE